MKLTDFPPEILRKIIELATDSLYSYPCYENFDPEEISPWPVMSFDSVGSSSYTFEQGLPPAPRATRFCDRLAVALVCRTFWVITCEFLYEAVSVSNAPQAESLACGLALRAVECDPAPGAWVKELEIKSLFGSKEAITMPQKQSISRDLKCILEHCTRLKALRISGSFLGRLDPPEINQLLSVVPTGIVHFELDGVVNNYRSEGALASSRNGLYAILERLRPTLRVLQLPASQYVYLTGGLPSSLDGITHFEIRSFSAISQKEKSKLDGGENTRTVLLPLESLTHLNVSHLPRETDYRSFFRFLSINRPRLTSVRFGRLVDCYGFPMHVLLNCASNLQEFDYWPFSLLLITVWERCSSKSLRHVVLRANETTYGSQRTFDFPNRDRRALFAYLRRQLHPLSLKTAFPALQSVTVLAPEFLASEIITKSLGGLKAAGIKVSPGIAQPPFIRA